MPPKVGALGTAWGFRQQHGTAFQALRRPARRNLVKLGFGRGIGRQLHPRLLRYGIDMNVGRQTRGFIERANADKANGFAGAGIVAPYGDFAFWTPRYPLALAAVGPRVDGLDVARQQLHSIRFDHGVEGERGTRLSLAPAAVAAVSEKGFAGTPNGTRRQE